MKLTRRNLLISSSAGFAAVAMGSLPAFASLVDDAIKELTGGAELGSGAITLDAPEIAENGNTVPIGVTAPGAVAITLYYTSNCRDQTSPAIFF